MYCLVLYCMSGLCIVLYCMSGVGGGNSQVMLTSMKASPVSPASLASTRKRVA